MIRRQPEDVFLFVNPKSGGNKGEDFLKVPQPFLVDLDDGLQASLHIYSLLDGEPGNKVGFKRLAQTAASSSTPIKTIVGGGDGTVMWADTEATSHGICTPEKLVYGIVPLGTGNDFSRVAGWGGKNPVGILDEDCQVVRKLVQRWCKARPRPHDVWQVCIKVKDDEGAILVVDKNKEETEFHNGTVHKLTLPMINYFSLGQESKVGIEFDKHRTKNQTCNLFVYACEGVVTEMRCCSQQHVGNLIRVMHHGPDADAPVILGGFDDDEDEDAPQLIGNPESLMFLNINSYAGGNAHFWQRHCEPAVDPEPPAEDIDVDPDPGDGRLEVLTLPNIVGIPLDKIEHMGKRLISGAPFYIEFEEGEDGEPLDVYCEVDGEFFHLVNPGSASVSLGKTLMVLQSVEEKKAKRPK